PGKASTEPVDRAAQVRKDRRRRTVPRCVDDMPQLRTEDAGDRDISDHGVRIDIQLSPLDFGLKGEIPGDECQAHEQTEWWDIEIPDGNEREQCVVLRGSVRFSINAGGKN